MCWKTWHQSGMPTVEGWLDFDCCLLTGLPAGQPGLGIGVPQVVL